MDENKSMSLAVLGVVAVIATVSVVLLLTNSDQTGLTVGVGDKVYGGALRGNSYPTRLVNGKIESLETGGQEGAWQEGVPYRSYKRTSPFIPSFQTSCGPDELERDFSYAKGIESRYDISCRKMNGAPDGRYCCPRINLAKDEVIE